MRRTGLGFASVPLLIQHLTNAQDSCSNYGLETGPTCLCPPGGLVSIECTSSTDCLFKPAALQSLLGAEGLSLSACLVGERLEDLEFASQKVIARKNRQQRKQFLAKSATTTGPLPVSYKHFCPSAMSAQPSAPPLLSVASPSMRTTADAPSSSADVGDTYAAALKHRQLQVVGVYEQGLGSGSNSSGGATESTPQAQIHAPPRLRSLKLSLYPASARRRGQSSATLTCRAAAVPYLNPSIHPENDTS
ncbi:hypothetical protein B0H19DRAFT_1076805 [Mycena capillaripes]|nr:hypothetical protein B0H19DRAFT_1076805 [Mycena capillaripes]